MLNVTLDILLNFETNFLRSLERLEDRIDGTISIIKIEMNKHGRNWIPSFYINACIFLVAGEICIITLLVD